MTNGDNTNKVSNLMSLPKVLVIYIHSSSFAYWVIILISKTSYNLLNHHISGFLTHSYIIIYNARYFIMYKE